MLCTAFPSLRTNCPLKCEVKECETKCEDTQECPEEIVPELCELLSDNDKYKCNRTCGLCEEAKAKGMSDNGYE